MKKSNCFYFLGGADIPEDPTQALRDNAMSLTRIQAVQQCQQMTQLVDKVLQKTDFISIAKVNLYCNGRYNAMLEDTGFRFIKS